MSSSLVVPASLRGWLVLVAAVAVFAAGIWPVITLVNQARLVLGVLPAPAYDDEPTPGPRGS